MKELIKNISYTLFSNAVILIVNLVMVLFVPKILSVEQYGFWQLFLFYSSYVTLYTFGWTDGLYLRYGGKRIEDLDKNNLTGQFIFIVVLQVSIAIFIFCYGLTLQITEYKILFVGLAISACFGNISYFFTHLLQATGMFKRFAINTIVTRSMVLLSLSLLFFTNLLSFKTLVISNVIVAMLSFSYTYFQSSKYFIEPTMSKIFFDINEAKKNIKAGSVLLFANTINMLVIGVVRQGIQMNWGIEIFARISLMLSFLTFLVSFINAFSMVFYPTFRRISEDKLPSMLNLLKKIIYPILIIYLLTIKLAVPFIISWLPKYKDSVPYLLMLFPIGMVEMKINFINNTFLKVLRKEKIMMFINMSAVLLSIVSVIYFGQVNKSLNGIVASLVAVLTFRMIISDIYLLKLFKNRNYFPILFDLSLLATYYLSVYKNNNFFWILIAIVCVFVFRNKEVYLGLINKDRIKKHRN